MYYFNSSYKFVTNNNIGNVILIFVFQSSIISQDTVYKLCHMANEQNFKPILDEMLIERVVGTKNHEFIKTVNIK